MLGLILSCVALCCTCVLYASMVLGVKKDTHKTLTLTSELQDLHMHGPGGVRTRDQGLAMHPL
eukprot:120231-Ditylum_brightwellii.AAC.1